MLLINFAIHPLGKGDSVSREVSKAVDVIDRSGLKYQVGPMGTAIEGSVEDVLRVVRESLEALSADGASRIEFSINGDWRKSDDSRIQVQVQKVEQELNRPISH